MDTFPSQPAQGREKSETIAVIFPFAVESCPQGCPRRSPNPLGTLVPGQHETNKAYKGQGGGQYQAVSLGLYTPKRSVFVRFSVSNV